MDMYKAILTRAKTMRSGTVVSIGLEDGHLIHELRASGYGIGIIWSCPKTGDMRRLFQYDNDQGLFKTDNPNKLMFLTNFEVSTSAPELVAELEILYGQLLELKFEKRPL